MFQCTILQATLGEILEISKYFSFRFLTNIRLRDSNFAKIFYEKIQRSGLKKNININKNASTYEYVHVILRSSLAIMRSAKYELHGN